MIVRTGIVKLVYMPQYKQSSYKRRRRRRRWWW